MSHNLIIVGNQPILTKALHRLLTTVEESYHVESCSTAEAALQRVETGYIDLVIADLELPGRNCLELPEKIRRMNSSTRCILLTAIRSSCVEMQANGLAEGIVRKPFTANEILTVIRNVLAPESGLIRRKQ